jgi:hypothetical protein
MLAPAGGDSKARDWQISARSPANSQMAAGMVRRGGIDDV